MEGEHLLVEDLAAVILHANGNRQVPWFVPMMHTVSEARPKSRCSVFLRTQLHGCSPVPDTNGRLYVRLGNQRSVGFISHDLLSARMADVTDSMTLV